jgi:hypothetical protein
MDRSEELGWMRLGRAFLVAAAVGAVIFAAIRWLPTSISAGHPVRPEVDRNTHEVMLADVHIPPTTFVDGHELVLNGVGLRSMFMVRVYVASLYLETPSSNPALILSSRQDKVLTLHFLHSVGARQMIASMEQGIQDNSPNLSQDQIGDRDQLLKSLKAVQPGDELRFVIGKTGETLVFQNGKMSADLKAPSSSEMLLSVWMGQAPPTADVKAGLLRMP